MLKISPLDSCFEPMFIPQPQQTIYCINDRANQSSMQEFSSKTMIAEVDSKGRQGAYFQYKSPHVPLIEQRVFILVHGFNSPHSEVITTLKQIADRMQNVYDSVIAYSYPCQKSNFFALKQSYELGRKNALIAAKNQFPKVLSGILEIAKRVDIAAHSMGAYLVLNGLQSGSMLPKMVTNLFLVGGADSDRSFLQCIGPGCSPYLNALLTVRCIFNIYSCKDEILPLHTMLLHQVTMGHLSAMHCHLISRNVRFIDTTDIVGSHSAYLNNEQVIDFIVETSNSTDCNLSLIGRYFVLTKCGLFPTRHLAICNNSLMDTLNKIVHMSISYLSKQVLDTLRM